MQAVKLSIETLRILLIEDNPSDAEFLEFHLIKIRQMNVVFECSNTLSKGLERLSKQNIDLIFLDLTLPDSFGIDTVINTRRLARGIPIIVLTSNIDDELAIHALESGAQDYLVKSHITPQALERSINYALARQRGNDAVEWLAAIVESSSDAIIGRSLDNMILSWSHGAERMYGYKADDVLGKSMDILLQPGSNDLSLPKNQTNLREGIPSFETTRRRKDGTDIFVSISVSPMKDTSGKTTAFSVTARDMTLQRDAENELYQSDKRLRLAVDASKLGIWSWDTKTGKLLWDDRMFELYNTNKKDFDLTIGSCLMLIHPEDRQLIQNNLDMVIRGGFDYEGDFRILWTDGTIRYLEAKGKLCRDAHGEPEQMVGVCLDATERKLADQSLQTSEQRLCRALESAKMGVWDLNLANNTAWRSPAHDQIFGYDSTLGQWSFETFISHVHPDDRARVQQEMNIAIRGGRFNLECRVIHDADKSVHWISAQGETHINEQGKALRLMGTVSDITERRKIEQRASEAAKRREQISHAIVQHAPVGIVTLDSRLFVVDVNKAFASMIQRAPELLCDLPLANILPIEELRSALETIKLGNPIQLFRQAISFPADHSEWLRYWDISLWPVVGAENDLESAVLQVIDCTDKVLLEQQRDDFVAAVAHDIKNPLIGAERLFAALCSEPENRSVIHNKMLVVLRESNLNMLNLVQNLVDVYRYETLSYPVYYQEVDLKVLLENCVEQVSHFAESRDISIIMGVHAPCQVQIDEVGIRRVFMNLLHNAIKFNKHGGTMKIALHKNNSHVQIEISDSGYGIGIVEQQRLFKRFAQGEAGKRDSTGTGLGLFLSKQIISALHGSISCTSQIDIGTTFTIEIPINPTFYQDKEVQSGNIPCH